MIDSKVAPTAMRSIHERKKGLNRGRNLRMPRRLAAVAALALLAGLAHAAAPWPELSPQDLAETFPPEQMASGIRISAAGCAALKLAVWVEHAHGSECIRYFPSRDVPGARRAVFFFRGDLLLGRRPLAGASANNSVAGKLKEAGELARQNGVPFVLVSRPGTLGSSGEHFARRRPKEFHSLNAAVDAIKARHAIGEVILSGQSGGATAVGAMLTLGRTDVACAVATSGGYDVLGRALFVWSTQRIGRPGCDTTGYCDPYNVIDFTAGVAPNPARRIFIIGDPADSATPFQFQKAFAEKLRQAGHAAVLIEAKGEGREHHGLAHIATRAAGWCNAGLPSDEIARKVREYSGQLFRSHAFGAQVALYP